MPPTPHLSVKVERWNLPKNSSGHPIFASSLVRSDEVVLMDSISIGANDYHPTPIDMNNHSKVHIYGTVNTNHPFYIFVSGQTSGQIYFFKEIFPETIDGNHDFSIQISDTARYLWIGTSHQGLTFTAKYSLIE